MNNYLPVLAIETSGELCSVCLFADEKNYSEINILKKHIHSEKLFSAVELVVSNLDFKKTDIKSVAVSIGPGSFTGLRIGLSAAKGIALGLGIPIIPVNTFEALAWEIFAYNHSENKIAVVNKVNTTELYLQKFIRDHSGSIKSEELDLILNSTLSDSGSDYKLYGNFLAENIISLESPRARSIAKWAYLFAEDFVTFQYDYLEPNYVKNFVVKVKK